MSKFRCVCGYLIGFNVYPCRYDGNVIREQGAEAIDDTITRVVAEFLASVGEGRRDEWLRQFYSEVFPIGDASVISDIISRHRSNFMLAIHQCEQCGRLWLQGKSGENSYNSYLPEGAWRGALEKPASGFVGYVGGQDFFDACIAEAQQEGETLRVILKRGDAETREVIFLGVSAIRHYDREHKRVRFLSEWEDTPPLRRFIFDNTSQSYEPILEITAREAHIGGKSAL